MSCSDEYISHTKEDSLIRISPLTKSKLQKAKYGIYNHSAVEICHWTKKSFANEGNCYKHKFYGISTHRCMEMTPTAMNCENRCIYCWRPTEFYDTLQMPAHLVDEPDVIINRLIKEDALPTQLYLSTNASNRKMFYQINRPKYKDAWDRWLTTLNILAGINTRTVLRMTLIRNYNSDLNNIPEFVNVINKANPHFIEVKSYMHIGMSTNRLEHNNMLDVKEVREFTNNLQKNLQDYNIMDESEISRIVVLQNQNRYTNRWIKEYFEPTISFKSKL